MEGGSGIPNGGSNIAPSAMLGLEMPLHHHQQKQQQQLLSFPARPREAELRIHPQKIRPSGYGANFTTDSGRGKQQQQQQQPSLSSEEEAHPAPEVAGKDGTKLGVGQTQTPSPWQRMKWTDSMIRLLIMVVYFVGDDGGADGGGDTQHAAVGKGKKAASSAGQLQQKKGKWKSVSRAMMERGYCVSPQQCEDKFNDLNKRYKRVNDLLGKGTACRVVENQSLLDSMDHLSPKAKEEARKLLNSKHLFFREMCAYHTSCTAAATPLPPATAAPDNFHDHRAPHLHAAAAAAAADAPGDPGHQILGMERERCENEDEADNEVEGEDDYDDDYVDDEEEEEEEEGDHRPRHHHAHQYRHGERERDADEDTKATTTSLGGLLPAGAKRPRSLTLGLPSASSVSSPLSLSLSSPSSASTSMQQLRSELKGLATGGVSEQHQRQWLTNRALEVEEQQVRLQNRALELDRQRFKWLRFSSNKERELERTKLENERLRLENERMLLLLRQKELQLRNSSDTVTLLGNANDAQQQQELPPGNHKRSTDHHHYTL